MNWNNSMMSWGNEPWFGAGIGLLALWSLFWKGLALWTSARKSQKIWFVVLLVVNTIGILDILYIFLFSKIKLPAVKDKTAKKRK